MFVCLQKDAKQWCDATKMGCTHCSGRLLTAVGQNNKYNPSLWHYSIVWRLFGDKKTSKSLETQTACKHCIHAVFESAFYNESRSAFHNEFGSRSSPCFITYPEDGPVKVSCGIQVRGQVDWVVLGLFSRQLLAMTLTDRLFTVEGHSSGISPQNYQLCHDVLCVAWSSHNG